MALFSITVLKQKAPKYDFVVAKDGSGNFTTIQAAIEASKAFPEDRIRIFIKNGVYMQRFLFLHGIIKFP